MSSSQIQNISIYIPRVFKNISEERMKNIFEILLIGKVNHIDVIEKRIEKNKTVNFYNSVYIHFDYWYDNVANINLQDRILNHPEKETRIVYDDPWYWIVLWNKSEKKSGLTPQKRINIEGLEPRNLAKEFKSEKSECVKKIVSHVIDGEMKKPFAFIPRQITMKKMASNKILGKVKKDEDEDYVKKLELENNLLKKLLDSLSTKM